MTEFAQFTLDWRLALIAAADGIPDEYRGIPAMRADEV